MVQKCESNEIIKSEMMDSTVRMTSWPVAKDISKSSCGKLAQRGKVGIIGTGLSYLCELGLSVCPQIFIAETAGKLVVCPNATRHENLLVLLGALG